MNEKYNIKNWIKHLFVVPWTPISNSFDRKMIEFQLFRVCALASFSKWIHKSTENKWNITYLKRQWNTVMLACCMHTSSMCILPSSPTEKKLNADKCQIIDSRKVTKSMRSNEECTILVPKKWLQKWMCVVYVYALCACKEFPSRSNYDDLIFIINVWFGLSRNPIICYLVVKSGKEPSRKNNIADQISFLVNRIWNASKKGIFFSFYSMWIVWYFEKAKQPTLIQILINCNVYEENRLKKFCASLFWLQLKLKFWWIRLNFAKVGWSHVCRTNITSKTSKLCRTRLNIDRILEK